MQVILKFYVEFKGNEQMDDHVRVQKVKIPYSEG